MQFKRKPGRPFKCPHCSGYNTIRKGTRKTNNGLKRRLLCKDCGKRHSFVIQDTRENDSEQ